MAMSPFKALSKLTYRANMDNDITVEQCLEWYNIVETALKALEIIKEKRVDVRFLFQCKSLKDYNYIYKETSESNLCLTKEEYKLLKEELL